MLCFSPKPRFKWANFNFLYQLQLLLFITNGQSLLLQFILFMNDQQSQIVRTFSFSKSDFLIEMQILSQDMSLLINLINQTTLECFEQKIDQSYINDQQTFKNIFANPTQLMDFITHFSKDIIIESNGGLIKFSVKFFPGMDPKIIQIGLTRREGNRTDVLKLKYQKVKQTLEKSLLKHQQNIERLEGQQLQANNRISTLQNLNQSTNEIMRSLAAEVEDLRRQNQESGNLTRKILVNRNHPENPHSHLTASRFTGNSYVINGSEGGYFNFIPNLQINPGETVRFNIKIVNFVNPSFIALGFGSRAIFGLNSFSNQQSVCLRLDGNSFEGGQARNRGLVVGAGEKIECQLNLNSNSITWRRNATQIALSDLPLQMRNIPLYFYVSLSQRTSEVQILF